MKKPIAAITENREIRMPNMMMKTEIDVFAVPTAPTAWSLTDDSIRVSTMPDSM